MNDFNVFGSRTTFVHSKTEKTKKKPPMLNKSPKTKLSSNFGQTLSKFDSILKKRKLKLKHHQFEFLQTLGTGTFGRVRLVFNKKYKKYFAMKILHKEDVLRLKQVEHVVAEKRILEKVDHPFIVKLHSSYQSKYSLFMVQEFVIGGELFTQLRKYRKFPNEVAKFYAAEIVLALNYLHKKNILYRDLKPENILLNHDGHVKITDFGFAKHCPNDRTWTMCGTPEYLAPEIIQSKGHGKACDWWSFGVLLYEMLVGYTPFFDSSHIKIYEKILARKLSFPRFVDPAARDLIRRLLVVDKMKRLGNLKDGGKGIQKHKWFLGVNWEDVHNKKIHPPIGISKAHSGDGSNYDRYDEEKKKEFKFLSNDAQDLFKDFEKIDEKQPKKDKYLKI